MRYLKERVNGICKELQKLSVRKKYPVENWKYKKGNYLYPEDVDAAGEVWQAFHCNTMKWYGPDEHYWFSTEYTVPQELDGKVILLHVCTQIDEWDDAKNPQFLLFLNQEEIQGIDMNHREVLLTESAIGGETLQIDLQAYTGILHSEFNLNVTIQEIDMSIQKLYYDLVVPLSAFGRMEEDDKTRLDIQKVLNSAINLLDLRTPYSEEFYQSIKEADFYLNKALYEDMTGYSDVVATCIGHTHIDVAWWWTVAQTREKVARSFATVLKLMDEYPNYKFMSSQPILYSFLKERYPKLYSRLKEKVKEGRWEPEGGMWVEADCNLTAGESLVRQFIYGKRFFKEEFGVDNKILWLPDVFGYSGALPQIMKKSGIDYFMTTKLAWNQFNKMPYDTFKWRGIDGTEILTHLVTTLDIGQNIKNFFTTYNGRLHPDSIMGGWMRYQNKDINNDILISYGFGDGGGGPTREMLEYSQRMEKGIKGIPKVRQEFSRKFFDELSERVEGNHRLPTWEGELYFEYHRGTYTSMARNKRSNRKSEFMLMDLEFLSSMAEQSGVDYPSEQLNSMWKTILMNQFHDILPGSSIKEVYEVTKKEYVEIDQCANELIMERLKTIAGDGDGISIVNTLGFYRDDIVKVDDLNAEALVDDMGNVYPVQHTSDGALVYLTNLPSKGIKTYKKTSGHSATTFELRGNQLETPFYSITIDEQGLFTSIYDKQQEREILKDGLQGNLMRIYEDKPIYFDNWDIDIYYSEKFWDINTLERMEWTEHGTVRAALELERRVSNSVIRQKIYFYANNRRIDFETYVDWKEHQHLLKVHFPVNIHTDEATFDIQFGNVTRKTHSNTSWDMARFESCGQKWIDLSEGHYGVSLLNDCKYGHSVKDGNMALTLIKSGIEPNPVTDQEEHYFTYALYPHQGNWKEGKTAMEAAKLNVPAYAVNAGAIFTDYSFVSVDKENIMLETVKKAEDGRGFIIRLYEYENALTKAKVTFAMNSAEVEECNLLEEKLEDVTCENGSFKVKIKPYEIKTFRIIESRHSK